MLRAMYSAVSGLAAHQFGMDVIGNDLSNINTVGYKSRRAMFSDAFTQTSRAASSAVPVPIAVGLGAQVSATDTNFTQGAFQRTDIPTDLGIAGGGFFMLGTASTSTTPTYFTRAGNFTKDNSGYLRNADGYYLLGFDTTSGGAALANCAGFAATAASNTPSLATYTGTQAAPAGLEAVRIPTTITTDNSNVASFSIGSDGKVVVVSDSGLQSALGFVSIATFASENGLTPTPGTLYQSSAASGTATTNPPGIGLAGKTQAGVLELSNVDIAAEFSKMILTQRGFDANARTISAADEMMQTAVNIKR